jgi:hypothetical protein
VHRVQAHRDLRISPKEFDEVAAELGDLDFFKVPKREKTEVLAAIAAHKGEVTLGTSRTLSEVEAPCVPGKSGEGKGTLALDWNKNP